MLGELVQTTAGKWIIHPPTRCPNGHRLGPGEVFVGHQAMSSNARILLSHNVFRLSIPGLIGNFPNEVLPANSIETGQFLSLAQSAPQ